MEVKEEGCEWKGRGGEKGGRVRRGKGERGRRRRKRRRRKKVFACKSMDHPEGGCGK